MRSRPPTPRPRKGASPDPAKNRRLEKKSRARLLPQQGQQSNCAPEEQPGVPNPVLHFGSDVFKCQTANNSLSSAEEQRLKELEQNIRFSLAAIFVEVGRALLEIRDSRLYRAEFSSFEEYCRKRCKISQRHANRLIESAGVAQNLGPIGPIQPTHESQIRPLTKLEPEDQREAWKIASAANPNPTAKDVEKAVQSVQVIEPYRAPVDPTGDDPPFYRSICFTGAVGEICRIAPFDPVAIVGQELAFNDFPESQTLHIAQCNVALQRINQYLAELKNRRPLIFETISDEVSAIDEEARCHVVA